MSRSSFALRDLVERTGDTAETVRNRGVAAFPPVATPGECAGGSRVAGRPPTGDAGRGDNPHGTVTARAAASEDLGEPEEDADIPDLRPGEPRPK